MRYMGILLVYTQSHISIYSRGTIELGIFGLKLQVRHDSVASIRGVIELLRRSGRIRSITCRAVWFRCKEHRQFRDVRCGRGPRS